MKKRVWWDVSLHQNKLVASPKNIFRVWIWYRCVPQNIRKHVGKYFGSIEHILSPVAVGKDHLCNFENLTLNPPSTWTPPPKSAILSKFSVFSNFKSLQKSQIGSVLALPGLKRCELLRRIPPKTKKKSWRYSTNWDRQLKKTFPPQSLGFGIRFFKFSFFWSWSWGKW